MNLLSMLSPAHWAMVLLVALSIFGTGTVTGIRIEEDHRDAKDAKQVQQQLQAQVAATTHTLTEEHRKTDAVQEIANAADQDAQAYQADAAHNRAAGERLRGQLAAATERASAAQSAASAASQAASATRSVLADVQGRLAAAEDATVEFADASRRAGVTCERAYDALTPPTQKE